MFLSVLCVYRTSLTQVWVRIQHYRGPNLDLWAFVPYCASLTEQVILQSRSQSFVPLDQRSENESSGSIRFSLHLCHAMAHAWNGCSQSSRFPTAGQGERSSGNEIGDSRDVLIESRVYQLSMRNLNGCPTFLYFETGIFRVARFLTAGQGEQRLWVALSGMRNTNNTANVTNK